MSLEVVAIDRYSTTIGGTAVTFPATEIFKYQGSQPSSGVGARAEDDAASFPKWAKDADPGNFGMWSKRGVPPIAFINYLEWKKACFNIGGGFRPMTALDWGGIAFWCKDHSIVPHGNNGNTSPPSDVTFTTEIAEPDPTAVGYANKRALCGTGPVTWAHNHHPSGIHDLNGNIWEWLAGLMIVDGVARVMDVSKTRPNDVFQGTGVGTLNTWTDSTKAWTVDEWIGYYLFDGAGAWFEVTDSDATTLTVVGTPTSGVYEILKDTGDNITTGMTTGQQIATLWDTDADMRMLGVPATTAASSSAYNNDGYWFNVSGTRVALRGCNWHGGVRAGVWGLYLDGGWSDSSVAIGGRAARSI